MGGHPELLTCVSSFFFLFFLAEYWSGTCRTCRTACYGPAVSSYSVSVSSYNSVSVSSYSVSVSSYNSVSVSSYSIVILLCHSISTLYSFLSFFTKKNAPFVLVLFLLLYYVARAGETSTMTSIIELTWRSVITIPTRTPSVLFFAWKIFSATQAFLSSGHRQQKM